MPDSIMPGMEQRNCVGAAVKDWRAHGGERQHRHLAMTTRPEQVSHFFGISVAMHRTDRAPAHFHATYERHEALIAIETLEFVEGWLPTRAYALVLEWAAHHRTELRNNWDRTQQGQPLERVVPLE